MPNITMIQDRINIEIKEQIAFVSLSRAEKLNALDMAMFEAIVKATKQLKRNKNIRAIILSGDGAAFCSGLDVKSMFKNPLSAVKLLLKPGTKISNLAQDVGFLWRDIPVPVIAVTHGKCWGGGFQIALGADFRYTTADCEFSIMESRWGLIPDMSGTVTLRELASIDIIKELAMTARIFKGNEAKQLGLVTHVYSDPMAEAIKFAEEIKQRSPDAIACTKQLFNKTWLSTVKQALNWETKLQKKLIGRYNQRAAISQGQKKTKTMPFKTRS